MANQNTDRRPAESLRYGALEASIWRNQGESGDYLNTTFTRSYKQGEDWKQTDSFREADLPTLSKLALDAHTEIQKLKDNGRDSENGGL